jgi:hypothetical protein
MTDSNMHSASDVLATTKSLRKLARTVKPANRGSHHQIAMRRIQDAELFSARNTEYAIQCCWEARQHVHIALSANAGE